MSITEERTELLLNTLNEAVTMLLEAFNANKTQTDIVVSMEKKNHRNHKEHKIMKNVHFIRRNMSANSTIKKISNTTTKKSVKNKRFH